MQKLGKPETGRVTRKDGQPLESSVPEYLVWPTHYPVDDTLPYAPVEVADFGESFLSGEAPDSLNTPLVLRAPEVIFGDKLDYRVDLWSMGCLVRTGSRLGANMALSMAAQATSLFSQHDERLTPLVAI